MALQYFQSRSRERRPVKSFPRQDRMVGKPPYDMVVDLRPWRDAARDEVLIALIRPIEFGSVRKPVLLGQGDVNPLAPQLRAFAISNWACSRHEPDVELTRPQSGYLFVAAAIANVYANLRVLLLIGDNQVAKKPATNIGKEQP
jgi:hypothetical protein